MAKKVKYTESVHQWEGIAIVRKEGQLVEVNLGVAQSDKKLKETGAKELFKNQPEGTIAIEVSKLADLTTVYELDVERFKEIAEISTVDEEKPETEKVEIHA